MTKVPPALIGAAAAGISFMAVGIPLYRHGWSLWPCVGVQMGAMVVLILILMKVQDKLEKKRGDNQ